MSIRDLHLADQTAFAKVCKDFAYNNKIDTEYLIYSFQQNLGQRLYIKYLFHFSLGLLSNKQTAVQQAIKNITSKMGLRNPSFIRGVKSWDGFFNYLSEQFSSQTIERIQNGKISLSQKYILQPDRILQLIAIARQMSLEDAINFSFLQNFLLDRASFKHL